MAPTANRASWYADVEENALENERRSLTTEIYQHEVQIDFREKTASTSFQWRLFAPERSDELGMFLYGDASAREARS